jgi:hypothetical protein
MSEDDDGQLIQKKRNGQIASYLEDRKNKKSDLSGSNKRHSSKTFKEDENVPSGFDLAYT